MFKLSKWFSKPQKSFAFQDNSVSNSEATKQSSVAQIMGNIYRQKLWGGKNQDFFSGQGSHSKKVVRPYLKIVSDLLNTHENSLVVCDLGCGDFNVGKNLVSYASEYIAVDVVDELIERNQKKFQSDNLSFHQLNLVDDALPKADVALVRQVLQHLSNEAIAKVTEKLKTYPYVLVTEHLPKGKFVSNNDKPTGVSTRLSKGSGVVLHDPPFNLETKETTELLRVNYNKGVIVTWLYQF